MKYFSIKRTVCVIPVHNYCTDNITVSLSTPYLHVYNGRIATIN